MSEFSAWKLLPLFLWKWMTSFFENLFACKCATPCHILKRRKKKYCEINLICFKCLRTNIKFSAYCILHAFLNSIWLVLSAQYSGIYVCTLCSAYWTFLKCTSSTKISWFFEHSIYMCARSSCASFFRMKTTPVVYRHELVLATVVLRDLICYTSGLNV